MKGLSGMRLAGAVAQRLQIEPIMRFLRTYDGVYLVGDLAFHKCLECGVAHAISRGIVFDWRFKTQGDHAGLQFYASIGGWCFELNVTDRRHWNWELGRFYSDDEEAVSEIVR